MNLTYKPKKLKAKRVGNLPAGLNPKLYRAKKLKVKKVTLKGL